MISKREMLAWAIIAPILCILGLIAAPIVIIEVLLKSL